MPRFLKRLLGAVAIVLVLLAINMAMSRQGFFGVGVPLYQVDLWKMAGINIILAVSLNLINGFTGQFSIGHIGFMAVGAYSSAYMTVYLTQGWEQSLAGMVGAQAAAAIIFTLVILVGALAAAAAGLIVGIPTLRLRGDYLAIATLGFAEIIRIVIVNIDKVGAATGFRGAIAPAVGRATIPAYTNFMWIGVFAVITIVVIYNIVNSDTGRALISIREDELAATAMGVNTTRYKVTAFVISAAFAGVAGALYGHWRLPHPNDFTFVRSFEIIIMIVLGGMGSITGAVMGALVITFLPELLRQLPGGVYDYRLVIYAALLILIMITRPQGMLGGRELPALFKGLRTKLSSLRLSPATLAAWCGGVGLIIGGVIGYLVRPDQTFERIADTSLKSSFNYILAGAIIGAISGAVIGYILAMLARMQGRAPQENLPSFLEQAQQRPEGDEAVGASKGVPIAEQAGSDAGGDKSGKEVV